MAEAAVVRQDDEESVVPLKERSEIVHNLRKPVQAHGETVNKLIFRAPTGGDIMQSGERWPVHIDWPTGVVTPNPAVMGMVMSVLATVPPSTIKMMDGNDFTDCAHLLLRFFVPDAQRS